MNDFWQLAASGMLRAQTQNYVPAVIAATLIAKNPTHYGFEIEYEAPLAYETVHARTARCACAISPRRTGSGSKSSSG